MSGSDPTEMATAIPPPLLAPHASVGPSTRVFEVGRLLHRLFGLADRNNSQPDQCMCVLATHEHTLKSLQIDAPMLALPLRGRKRAHEGDVTVTVDPGALLLVPGPRALDVENLPDPRAGEYRAVGVALGDSVLRAARALWGRRPPCVSGPVASLAVGDLAVPLFSWCAAHERGDLLAASHALTGVVLTLCVRGYEGVLAQAPQTLAMRVRAMVMQDPARAWTSADIEIALGMSGATLRRRLAAEFNSWHDIVMQARLACALELLYTTRLPVKSVAQRVGYRSAASFTQRFTERYGVEPSRVGHRL